VTGRVHTAEAGVPDPADGWEAQPRTAPPAAPGAPVLAVEGWDGPLDWLLEAARARRLDLTRLSVLALVEAFAHALDAALAADRAGRARDPAAGASAASPATLARWGGWLVMAAELALLRSRLLVAASASPAEAAAAARQAAALRQGVLDRAAVRRLADWLDGRPQLGQAVFARGGGPGPALHGGRTGDVTALLRACLVALRLPPDADRAAWGRRAPLWTTADALARLRSILPGLGGKGAGLAQFLPPVPGTGPGREAHCRAAVAATFCAALEMARQGEAALTQDGGDAVPWIRSQIVGTTSG